MLVNAYVDGCHICQQMKGAETKECPMTLENPFAPWEDISYDLIIKLPISSGFDSILVVVDQFSKMAHFIPCRESVTAEELAEIFLLNIWKLHGTPKRTISDRGTTFNSKFLKALYQ